MQGEPRACIKPVFTSNSTCTVFHTDRYGIIYYLLVTGYAVGKCSVIQSELVVGERAKRVRYSYEGVTKLNVRF